MQKFFKKYIVRTLALFFFYIIFCIFQNNFLDFVEDNRSFQKFEDFSEALVVGKIVADERGKDTGSANLGFISEGELDRGKSKTEGYRVLKDTSIPVENLEFSPYQSQYGLQGRVYSFLYRQLDFKLKHFEIINSLLLTLTICSLYFCYQKVFDKKYALIFLIVSISSPWVIIFARNFYWIPFTWYLPTLFAVLAYLSKKKTIFYCLLFASVLIKSLSGYEYLSSITLMACSVPLLEPFFKEREVDWGKQIREVLIIFLICVGGFLSAVLVHATSLGSSNPILGIISIFHTAARRTVGNEAVLRHPQGLEALNASPVSIVSQYITPWSTTIFLGIPGVWFWMLYNLSLFSLFLKLILRHPNRNRHWVIFTVSFLVPASWFVLAKTHSYFHDHLNFVLWYLNFIPAMVYILSDDFVSVMKWLSKVALGIRGRYLRANKEA
jgi:hypothetical protein